MSDSHESTPPDPSAPGSPPPPAGAAETVLSPKEVEEGKVFAILSYVINITGVPFWLVPLIMRNNDFALYHAKQNLMLWLALLVAGAVAGILSMVCIGLLLVPVILVMYIVWIVTGTINAVNGRCKPLFLIGPYAEQWFAGIRKVPA